VQGLNIDLFDRLDVNEAHRRSRHGVGDCVGIQCVVLIRLQRRLHELGRDDPHDVAKTLDLPSQPL
jgi:hypothetical protein